MSEKPKDIKSIFLEAIEKKTAKERAVFLDHVCGNDANLRADFESLLKEHDVAGDFLESPAIEPAATLDNTPLIEGPGTKIGRYELLELIGEGGMGLVYLAEQKEPVKRRVALKIIKPGMDSRQVIARFEAEKQTLAVLDHPNIAHVLDAGTTKEGRPYFIMEYVKGMSITKYCDENKLNIEQRLRLFEQVCEGVHHAHQKGIIHRDIKPSNILVSVHGDRAVPKIIDFGIAKAVAQPLTEKTIVTFQGQLLGTPEYMSPEQVDMAMQDIDTRSDIYSLGVVLYELLAGIVPFGRESLAGLGFAEIQRTIREKEPSSPSTRLTSLGEQAKTIAESRGTQVIALARRLHRELEWIPLKAMRKDRCRRYRSASEMADDIHNYLNGRPLIAGPETSVYRIKKFVHKHAGSVATIALVTIAIVTGFIVSTTMYFRAEAALDKEARARIEAQEATKKAEQAAEDEKQATEREAAARAEAERAGAEAQMTSTFLTQVVLGSAPRSVKGRDATVLETLDVASEQLDAYFESEPNIEANILNSLGWAYWHLGDFEASALQLDRRYRILLEQGSKSTIPMNWAGVFYYFAGNYVEAEKLFDTIRQAQIHKNGSAKFWAICNLANACARQGRYQEAEKLFLQVFNKSAGWDPNHPGLTYEWDLAKLWMEQGRYEDAEKLFVSVLNAQRAAYGIEGDTGEGRMTRCMNELARLYMIQGRYKEAEAIFKEGIALGDNRWPGKDHPFTMRHVNGLGVLRTKQGRYEEAEVFFNRALEGRKLKLGEDHPYTLETINDFGLLRREQQRYQEADILLTDALKRRTAKLGRDHPHTLESLHELGVLYLAQSHYEDAEQCLLEALHGRENKFRSQHPQTVNSLREVARLYESWDKPNKAEEYRARLPQVKPNVGHDRPVLIGFDTFIPAGKLTYDDANDTYTILGCGRDIWGIADQFHYAHKQLNGNGSVTAKIESVEHLNNWTQAGVMIRETTFAKSAFAIVFITSQNRVCFKYRSEMGENVIAVNSKPNTITLPCWVRLIREGNTFNAQFSGNGSEWKDLEGARGQLAVMHINMNDPVHVGLAVCSRVGPGIPAEARISNVTFTGDVKPPYELIDFESIGFETRALPD